MSPFPFVPDDILEMLRLERERRYALSAVLAQIQCDCHPCRSMPGVVAKPIAGLGHLFLVTGHRLEIAAGLQLHSAAWPLKYKPCEECGD